MEMIQAACARGRTHPLTGQPLAEPVALMLNLSLREAAAALLPHLLLSFGADTPATDALEPGGQED